MLRVTVEVLPYGDEAQASNIAKLDIINVGGTRERGNYETRLFKNASAENFLQTDLVGYDRLNNDVFNLVSHALQEHGYPYQSTPKTQKPPKTLLDLSDDEFAKMFRNIGR